MNKKIIDLLSSLKKKSGGVLRGAVMQAVNIGWLGDILERMQVKGLYTMKYYNPDGTLGWRRLFPNLVATAGKNNLLDTYFAGSAYTAAWYLGLVDGTSTPTFAAGDTMASHAGWTENIGYSNSTRVSPSWNAAGSGSKATTATTFNINANGTIAGCFLTTVATKSGTTGILLSCGAFTGGNASVTSGGTLQVTYTASV